MREILPHLIEFGSRNIPYASVSSEWRETVSENNRAILEGIRYSKYPEATDIYSLFVSIVYANDMNSMKKVLNQYQGYIPIRWHHLLPYVESKEMLLLFMNKIGDSHMEEADTILEAFNTGITFVYPFNTYLYLTRMAISHRLDQVDIHISTPDSHSIKRILGLYIDVLKWLVKHKHWKGYLSSIIQDDLDMFVRMRKYAEINIRDTISICIKMDSISIFKYLVQDWNGIGYPYGKILSFLLDEGYIDTILSAIEKDGTGDSIDRFNLVYMLSNRIKDESLLNRIILISARNGYIEILDKYMNKDNTLYILSHLMYHQIIDIAPFLAYKGMYPSWFLFYANPILYRKPSGINPSFWKVYLANLIVYASHMDIIENIILEHMKDITPEIVEKILQLAKKNKQPYKMRIHILSLLGK